jgi:hypothetical protein
MSEAITEAMAFAGLAKLVAFDELREFDLQAWARGGAVQMSASCLDARFNRPPKEK